MQQDVIMDVTRSGDIICNMTNETTGGIMCNKTNGTTDVNFQDKI
jgi:hypothetical protein